MTTRPLCAAALCTTLLGGAAAYARQPSHQTTTAIRVGGFGSVQALAAPAPPPAAGPISLYQVVSQARAGATSTTDAAVRQAALPPTTSTSVPVGQAAVPVPPPPAPSTTAATTPLAPLTPLVEQLAPGTASALGALTGSDRGAASWFHAPAGTCAHRDLPLGTVIRITRISTGASATCRVADRGPTLATNRVIDLSADTFEKLASTDAGVIDVRIDW